MEYTVKGYRTTPTGKVHLFPTCRATKKSYPTLESIGQVTVNGKEICRDCWKRKVTNARKAGLKKQS